MSANADVEAAVAKASRDFEEAVLLGALPSGPPDPKLQDLVAATRKGLTALAEEAKTASGERRRGCVLEAEALARRRAYVLPEHEVRLEAGRCVEELAQWSVPSAVMQDLKAGLLTTITAKDTPPEERRAAHFRLLDDFDYWDWYIDWYAARSRVLCILCVVVAALGLGGAALAFRWQHPVVSFVLAGLAGTLVSIAIKMPTLIVYGEASAYTIRVLGRIATGLAASVIGGALLVSGIVTLPLGTSDLTLARIIEGSQPSGGPPSETADGGVPRSAAASQPGDGGVAPATSPPKRAPGEVKQPGAPVKPGSSTAMLVLLGLGMLIGFSERSLARFEDRVLPESGERPRKDGEKTPGGQTGAPGGTASGGP